MREILFIGKDENGIWHYGDLVHDAFDGTSKNIAAGIKTQNCYPVEVIPETVGQFTGLTDKNGVKIFEGDIVNLYGNISVCKFINGSFVFGNEFDFAFGYEVEVIGNIHDNPELLK